MKTETLTARLLCRIRDRYGAEPEYLWAALPNAAAIRCPTNGKWFAAVMTDLPRSRLGLPGEGAVDAINVKCDPRLIGSLRNGRSILPAYHMNKEHWVSLVLDGSLPIGEVMALVEMSYDLVSAKKAPRR